MKKTSRFRSQLNKILLITFCWVFIIAIFYINDYYFVYDLILLGKLTGNYEFWPDFIGRIILGTFEGLVGGYLLVVKLDYRYKRKSFAYNVIYAGFLFVTVYMVLAVTGLYLMDLIYFSIQTDFMEASRLSYENVLVNFNTLSFIFSMILTGMLVSATQFMLQINDKFGSGVLWKFIKGKYYHPQQEERIFMFLDLKSSTAIAEKLGSKRFFEFLREIFQEITKPIIDHMGEIYQYVGDEIVVTWTEKNGASDNNCLRCFFKIEQLIQMKSDYFKNEYGHLPVFKAGLHFGEATVGEIGVIKKDIVYSGDVLNTASRIQNACNEYGVNILLSSDLISRMPLNGEFFQKHVGEISLRGKENLIALTTIEKR